MSATLRYGDSSVSRVLPPTGLVPGTSFFPGVSPCRGPWRLSPWGWGRRGGVSPPLSPAKIHRQHQPHPARPPASSPALKGRGQSWRYPGERRAPGCNRSGTPGCDPSKGSIRCFGGHYPGSLPRPPPTRYPQSDRAFRRCLCATSFLPIHRAALRRSRSPASSTHTPVTCASAACASPGTRRRHPDTGRASPPAEEDRHRHRPAIFPPSRPATPPENLPHPPARRAAGSTGGTLAPYGPTRTTRRSPAPLRKPAVWSPRRQVPDGYECRDIPPHAPSPQKSRLPPRFPVFPAPSPNTKPTLLNTKMQHYPKTPKNASEISPRQNIPIPLEISIIPESPQSSPGRNN